MAITTTTWDIQDFGAIVGDVDNVSVTDGDIQDFFVTAGDDDLEFFYAIKLTK